MPAEDTERLRRERDAAVNALRQIRDSSISWDDAVHIAAEGLRKCGVVPEPTFDSAITAFLSEQQARARNRSLGEQMQQLAAGEAVTREMLTGPIPPRLLEDLRCASCERQEQIHGPAGLCDGCLEALEALEDDAA